MKKLLLFLFIIMVIGALVFGGCTKETTTTTSTTTVTTSSTATSAPIVLKYVTFYPDIPGIADFSHMLIDKIKAKTNGAVVIDWVGGPETIPPPDISGAVQRGTVDMVGTTDPFTEALAPGTNFPALMSLTLEEFRKGGGYDLVNEQYMKAGMFFLGSAMPCPPNSMARFHLNKEIKTLDDLKGFKFGAVSSSYFQWFESMGATAVTINMPDYFTALERGTVDAVELGVPGIIDWGLQDVIKYELMHSYGSTSASFVVNLGVWNKIPKNLQDKMIEAALEVEKEGPHFMEIVAGIDKIMADKGTKFIKLPAADEERFYQLYQENVWPTKLAKIQDPVLRAKLEEVLKLTPK